MRFFWRAIFVWTLFYSPIAFASEANIAGLGTLSCLKFIELKKLDQLKEPEGEVLTWSQGFLTGMNTLRFQQRMPTSINIPNRKVLSVMIEGICYRDPERSIFLVMTEVARDLLNQGKVVDNSKLLPNLK